jgi:hypothetical protein
MVQVEGPVSPRRARAEADNGGEKTKSDEASDESSRPIADNRKAYHDYHILETFECGIALLGPK